MIPGIYCGKTHHIRFRPKRHEFSYPLYYLAFDINKIKDIINVLPLFAYNKTSLFSLHDTDYLRCEAGTIRQKVDKFLKSQGVAETFSKIILVTMPRMLGYVFNPVSFYLCYDDDKKLQALIAEVNNTFGERHCYFMPVNDEDRSDTYHFKIPKEFFVSPFFKVDGEYSIFLRDKSEKLDISITLKRAGERHFNALLSVTGKPFSKLEFIKTIAKYPLLLWLTMSRIHFQALKLKFLKGLDLLRKPKAVSLLTEERHIKCPVIKLRTRLLNFLASNR